MNHAIHTKRHAYGHQGQSALFPLTKAYHAARYTFEKANVEAIILVCMSVFVLALTVISVLS